MTRRLRSPDHPRLWDPPRNLPPQRHRFDVAPLPTRGPRCNPESLPNIPPVTDMTSIGRIFIVVNLVLAGLAVGWASTQLGVAQNWKEEARLRSVEADTQLATVNADLATANATLAQERTNKNDAQSALSTTQASLTEVREALASEREKNTLLTNDIDSIKATISTFQQSTEDLVAQKDAAEEALNEAKNAERDAMAARDVALGEMADLVDNVRTRDASIGALQADLVTANKEIASLGVQLDTAIELGGLDRGQIAMGQKKVDGGILGVNTSIAPGIVSINKGSADNVSVGYTFEIYDLASGTYKGKVRVVEVQGNMCVAEIVKTMPGTSMAQGDSASTSV